MIDSWLGTTVWTAPAAMVGIGVVAALLVLLWDWRLLLPGLALVQYGVGQLLVYRYGVPAQWLAIYFWVVLLAALILALSPLQTRSYQIVDRSGNPFFRGLLLLLLGVVVYSIAFEVPLPVVDLETARLFLWLAACALLILALTDSPLLTGAGLLLWFIPVQSLMAVILPLPALIALLGALALSIALVCSYLDLAESEQVAEQQRPLTDVTFPVESEMAPSFSISMVGLRRLLAQRLAALTAMLKRVGQ